MLSYSCETRKDKNHLKELFIYEFTILFGG